MDIDLETLLAHVLGLPSHEGCSFPHGFVTVTPFPFER